MPKKIDKIIDTIDQLIRKGEGGIAQLHLKKLSPRLVPLDKRPLVAALATRAGLPNTAITLLRPIIHPGRVKLRSATVAEVSEYAMALIRIGAHAEAGKLLAKVPPQAYPRALSYQAILSMKEWRYKEAVPLLRQYIESEENEYFRFVGKTNLAQSLLAAADFEGTEKLLKEILNHAKTEQLRFQHGNAYSLLGLLEFKRQNWSAALSHLKNAELILSEVGGVDLFFVRKWTALTRYFQSNGSESSVVLLENIRLEAKSIRHWETLRDLEHYVAVLTKSEPLFLKLYFGSPFESFRQRLMSYFPQTQLPEVYLYALGEGTKKPRLLPNFIEEEPGPNGDTLKAGQSLHRLYCTLLSDFYRPFTIVNLFEKMFPGDFYSLGSSKHRVWEGVRRLREWLVKNEVPLNIQVSAGEYSLEATTPCTIPVRAQVLLQFPLERVHKTITDYRLTKLQTALGDSFSVKEAMEVLQLGKSSTCALLLQFIEKGELTKTGGARTTRYHFQKTLLKESA